MTDYNEILKETSVYVQNYFETHYDDRYIYHNLKHTQAVVNKTEKIGNHFQLDERDFCLTMMAAWFHDLGYFTNHASHEFEGIQIAKEFLKGKGLSGEDFSVIEGCILATRLPQKPKTLLEEIVCDADLYHLGTDDFKALNKLMKKEAELFKGEVITGKVWRTDTIKLLRAHTYHTDYCRLLLQENQENHIKELEKKDKKSKKKNSDEKKQSEKKLEKSLDKKLVTKTSTSKERAEKELVEKEIPEPTVTPEEIRSEPILEEQSDEAKSLDSNEKKAKKEKADKKKSKLMPSKMAFVDDKKRSKGVETMFKISSNNNQRLSKMADYKARVMISVNSIILSLVVALLLRHLDTDEFLAIPTFIILGVCVASLIFAILATRPTLAAGRFTQEAVDNKEANLLFFGNFYKMDFPSYEKGMWKVMEDNEYLYGSLIKDVYSQGVVLGRKYKLLRLSFNIFMVGLIVSVLAFIIASSIVLL